MVLDKAFAAWGTTKIKDFLLAKILGVSVKI